MAAIPPMLQDIARQPAVLAALAGRAAEFTLPSVAPHGRVWVCGCGDGLFAAQAAKGAANRAGLDWRPVGALDLLLAAGDLRPGDRVVAVSMSGNVDRTVEAAQAAAGRGVPVLALVNGAGGRLAAVAGSTLSLDVPDLAPFLCGTATYTATLAALLLLAGVTLDGMAGNVAAAVAAPVPSAGVPTGVRILAAGAEAGTAQYAAAKFVELTRIPAWHGDIEEFAHSQYWSMPPDNLVVLIATTPAVARHANDTCDALGQLGVPTLAIHQAGAPVPAASMHVTLPDTQAALAPLLSALPLQRLAYDLALRTGLDPNTRRHLKDDADRFRVSRLLTRRSLVGTGQ